MLDIWAIKRLGNAFAWFHQLGASDAKQMRNELQDLLRHCAQTITALVELIESLYEIDPEEFSEQTFRPIYLHCVRTYTSPDAARQARSHCTDIERDIARIKFKAVRMMRTEGLQLQSLDTAFAQLVHGDGDLLALFENDMKLVNGELQQILALARSDRQQAWQQYDQLRGKLIADLAELNAEFNKMHEAEDHIRRLLT